jgi:hypothetical protein
MTVHGIKGLEQKMLDLNGIVRSSENTAQRPPPWRFAPFRNNLPINDLRLAGIFHPGRQGGIGCGIVVAQFDLN